MQNFFCYHFVNFLPTLLLFLQHVFWPEVLNEVYRLWLHESFIGINFSLRCLIFCKLVHFSGKALHSLQLYVTDFYSYRFLHIVIELCWPVKMKSSCISGWKLSSRPELSWEMSLSHKVLSCSLHFFCCGKNLQNVNQKSCLRCKNTCVIAVISNTKPIYPVQNLLM